MYKYLQKAVDRVNQIIQENLTAIRAIKAFVRDEYEEDTSDDEIDEIALNWMIDKNIWQSIKENPNKVKEICKKNNIPVCFATSRLAKEGIISHKSKLYLDNRESID